MGPWAERGLTLLIALAGLGFALLLSLPLPALFGPMLACLAAALLGAPLRGLSPATTAARTVLGVAVGASVTPTPTPPLKGEGRTQPSRLTRRRPSPALRSRAAHDGTRRYRCASSGTVRPSPLPFSQPGEGFSSALPQG